MTTTVSAGLGFFKDSRPSRALRRGYCRAATRGGRALSAGLGFRPRGNSWPSGDSVFKYFYGLESSSSSGSRTVMVCVFTHFSFECTAAGDADSQLSRAYNRSPVTDFPARHQAIHHVRVRLYKFLSALAQGLGERGSWCKRATARRKKRNAQEEG